MMICDLTSIARHMQQLQPYGWVTVEWIAFNRDVLNLCNEVVKRASM